MNRQRYECGCKDAARNQYQRWLQLASGSCQCRKEWNRMEEEISFALQKKKSAFMKGDKIT